MVSLLTRIFTGPVPQVLVGKQTVWWIISLFVYNVIDAAIELPNVLSGADCFPS